MAVVVAAPPAVLRFFLGCTFDVYLACPVVVESCVLVNLVEISYLSYTSKIDGVIERLTVSQKALNSGYVRIPVYSTSNLLKISSATDSKSTLIFIILALEEPLMFGKFIY